jgi:hypothetical protein
VRLAIGDFSRMTHLSVKALRHYHDVGLLEPAEGRPRQPSHDPDGASLIVDRSGFTRNGILLRRCHGSRGSCQARPDDRRGAPGQGVGNAACEGGT